MSRPCLWLLPVFGSLYFLPLRGDEDLNDSANILDPTQETPITDFLGRADLLDPGSPASKLIEEPNLPLPVTPISPKLPEKTSPAESDDSPEPNTVLPTPETTPSEIPSAGTGPGELQGVIFDPDGNGIPGVIITLPELGGLQLRTDEKGEFKITGLPTDGVKAELLKPAYTTKLEVFQIKAEGITKARVSMELKPIELADGEYLLEDREVILDYEEEEFGGILLGGATDLVTVSSGIGKEEFSKLGVSDAAGAVGKIAGANIVGGKFAVVRGLGDRYSNTLFNNSLISSADPSRKAVQLDLFPSELLQSVEIQKNYSPEYTAEWAGGLVKIKTLGIPEERLFKVKVGSGTDDQLRSAGDFFAIPGADFGFLRGASRGELSNGFGVAFSSRPPLARDTALNQTFGLRPIMESQQDEIDFGIIYGDVFQLTPEMKLGINLSFNRERQDSVTLGEIVNRGHRPFENTFDVISNRDTYEQNLNWGLLGGATLEIGDRHTLGVTYFRFSDTNNSAQLLRGAGQEILDSNGNPVRDEQFISSNPDREGSGNFFFGDAGLSTQSGDFLQTLERDLEVTQISGRHALGKDPLRGATINWSAARSTAEESRPQSTGLRFTSVDFGDPSLVGRTFERPGGFIPGTFIPLPPTIEDETVNLERGSLDTLGRTDGDGNDIRFGTRESLASIDTTNAVDLSFTLPFYFDDDSEDRFEISAGTSLVSKKRRTRGELFELFGSTSFNDDILVSDNGSLTGVEVLEAINGTRTAAGRALFSSDGSALFYERATTDPLTRRNIDAATDLDAYYLLGRLKKGSWDLVGGFRVEQERRSFEILAPGILNFDSSANPLEPIRGSEENTHIAPALTVTKTFGKENSHTLVGSWSETIARPTFFEFSPVFTEDQSTGDLRRGNPLLTDSTIMNFDLGWTWNSTSNSDYFRVNLFRKEISDTIVNSFLNLGTDSGRPIQTFINAGDGLLQGVELEGSLAFNDRWSVQGNYSFIDSELFVPFGTVGQAEVGFQGQPDHIFNLTLSYDNPDLGFNASLNYNYTDEFLAIVPESPNANSVNTLGRHTLNLVLQQKLNVLGSSGKLSFRVDNLLDEPITDIRRPSGRIRQRSFPGQSFSLSFSAEY